MKKVGKNMKNNGFVEYIIKNKYIILLVSIVFVMAFTGIIAKLMEIIFTLILIGLATYLGKKIQEDEKYLKNIFGSKKQTVEYKVKEDNKK